ncbi:erythronate-4-phosphate dehydrogenase [Legionella lansingensis]|uniref:Erythronate-4-phosphate dehydrogenase n=1 Tax=Legionella lansingensis TaxID=45067 RepID=A0A0W0VXF4_9GAMM|nr:4-phosphoerythronate dehydrogenase [Legionella lansingensis]KTD24780.1 erythronate-4-phosphate dehydrogenase [Legionella lansingensis]SNV48926.1 erythronate-4-phosphate dehydrogenase [Legionella lansingensis]
MKILADATLPGLHAAFPGPFELTLYHDAKEIPLLLNDQQILLCRSTLKVTQALLQNSSLSYVATASSGVDHIDEAYLKQRGIHLIDAKGSNAPAVADYIIASLAFLMIYKGFQGTKAAVIGAGKVGTKVAERLKAADLQVIFYDPPKARLDANFQSSSLEEVLDCDLISIHANLHTAPPYPSLNLINENLLKQLKPGCVIINTSRGGIVNEKDLLHSKYPRLYCTDVFNNEPSLNAAIVNLATLCTPHIAGHSIEAKYAAVMMISEKLHGLYQLFPPKNILSSPHEPPTFTAKLSWQDYVLSLYNPSFETDILKNTNDLESTFLSLRKAHDYRHDFFTYADDLEGNEKLLQILGKG